jgi:transcription-repair coupling factor (superfamily II helicase)
VGFGKTEIAIRAAFKVAADSRQVAVLVPTTILALQHYKTFSERLRDFPCRVDYLNRFRSTRTRNQILKDLEAGKIDILIGTHRILGKDLTFKDLGLLIIDEEQKFGVAAKERMKRLKINVDTLTLTEDAAVLTDGSKGSFHYQYSSTEQVSRTNRSSSVQGRYNQGSSEL